MARWHRDEQAPREINRVYSFQVTYLLVLQAICLHTISHFHRPSFLPVHASMHWRELRRNIVPKHSGLFLTNNHEHFVPGKKLKIELLHRETTSLSRAVYNFKLFALLLWILCFNFVETGWNRPFSWLSGCCLLFTWGNIRDWIIRTGSFNKNRKQCRDDNFREVDVMGSWCHVIDGYINVSVRLCRRPFLNSNLSELVLWPKKLTSIL